MQNNVHKSYVQNQCNAMFESSPKETLKIKHKNQNSKCHTFSSVQISDVIKVKQFRGEAFFEFRLIYSF